jgi:hypothetical protein
MILKNCLLLKTFIILLIIVFISLNPCLADGNEKGNKKDNKINPEYIVDYKNLLTSRFYLLNESIGFQVKPEGAKNGVFFKPNIHTKVGLAGFYKWFGLGLAVRSPFYKRDEDIKGKSKIIDLRINAYGKAIAAEISIQDYKGFYIDNPDEVYDEWLPGGEYPKRPDMRISSTSAIFYYIFNYKKHSIRAAYIQNERQLKSSGSLMLMPAVLFLKLSADSCIIPKAYIDKYNIDPSEQIKSGNFKLFGMSAGYSYTLVMLKYFYINASFLPGCFLQKYKYENNTGTERREKFSLLWLGRLAFGYNSDKFYAGIGGVFGFNSTPIPILETNFHYDMNQIRLWIGTRFNVFKKKN